VDHLTLALGENPAFSSVIQKVAQLFLDFSGGKGRLAKRLEEKTENPPFRWAIFQTGKLLGYG
jgi:hypothetical protein